jgi:predicted restriction endonuclease
MTYNDILLQLIRKIKFDNEDSIKTFIFKILFDYKGAQVVKRMFDNINMPKVQLAKEADILNLIKKLNIFDDYDIAYLYGDQTDDYDEFLENAKKYELNIKSENDNIVNKMFIKKINDIDYLIIQYDNMCKRIKLEDMNL